MNNIPEGSDVQNAPWNKISHPPKRFEVTVSMTVNKTFAVLSDDYDVEYDKDEDGMIKEFVYLRCNPSELIYENSELQETEKYLEDRGWIQSDCEADIYDY